MKDGLIRVAVATAPIVVADVERNVENIKKIIDAEERNGCKLLVFSELTLTGFTCGDLFRSWTLIEACERWLADLVAFSEGKEIVFLVGLPIRKTDKLYNTAAVVRNGKILGVAVKTFLPDYNEFSGERWFASAKEIKNGVVTVCGQTVPFGNNLVFVHEEMNTYSFGVEIGEDVLAVHPASERLCANGAHIICNLSASTETVGKAKKRERTVMALSERVECGYLYADTGTGESSQDSVFAGHRIIVENGEKLAESVPFSSESVTESIVDVQYLAAMRAKDVGFENEENCVTVPFSQKTKETELIREYPKLPFVPNENDFSETMETVFNIQSYGLKKRLEHVGSKKIVLGISGGLDSTMALLAAVRATDLSGRSREDILAVTMPCFGTSGRTYNNAVGLCKELGTSFREVNIADAVGVHFRDIGQDMKKTDVTFENSQARERTQVLMDIANQVNGLVLGTGDLSELALGWCTYNGDHMSMYGVNGTLPKTFIRYAVQYEAERLGGKVRTILYDILDTPISPELLPADQLGQIAQKTENLVGPYELNDFFLYYAIGCGFRPSKIFRLAKHAFDGKYADSEIKERMKTFYRRFFTQQFKRSCAPDGPKAGVISLSPRGDWRMPSDACFDLWAKEAESL